MDDEGLINYVKSHLDNGFSVEEIRQGLLGQHLSPQEVEEAINTAKASQYGGPVKPVPGLEEAKIERKEIPYGWKLGIGLVIVLIIVGLLIFYLFVNAKPTKIFLSISEFSLVEGVLAENLSEDSNVNFTWEGANYAVYVKNVNQDSIEFSGDINSVLYASQTKDFDLNNDGNYDVSLNVENFGTGTASVFFIRYLQIDSCTEDWNCTDWGPCIAGIQERVCLDDNLCGSEEEKPDVERTCTVYNQTYTYEANFSNETNSS